MKETKTNQTTQNKYCSQFKKNKIMVKFQKALLIIGCIAALLSGVISVINDKFDTYAFISALLFFNLYLNVMTIDKLEKK